MAVGSIDPFGLCRKTGKSCTNFLSKVFVTYLGCVITKIDKSKEISACYVKYVLFILEKNKAKRVN